MFAYYGRGEYPSPSTSWQCNRKEANGWQRYLNRRSRIKAELSKLGLTYAMPGAVSESNLANLLMNNPAAIGRLLNAAR